MLTELNQAIFFLRFFTIDKHVINFFYTLTINFILTLLTINIINVAFIVICTYNKKTLTILNKNI